jgi:hypothetical protein
MSEPRPSGSGPGDANARCHLEKLGQQPDDHRPFAHPLYWGAFICQGDPAPLPAVDFDQQSESKFPL